MIKTETLTSDQFIELTRATHELTSILNKSQVINLVLAKAAELSGCAGTSLVLFDAMNEVTPEVYSHGLGEEFVKDIHALSQNTIYQPGTTDEFESLENFPGSSREGIHSTCRFLIVTSGKLRGYLYFFNSSESTLAENQIQVLKVFANHAATAIDNALLCEEKERKIRQLNILNEATVSLSTEPDTNSLFQKLTDHAVFLLRADKAFLILLHPDSNRIHQIYQSGDAKSGPAEFGSQITGILSDMTTSHKVLNLQSGELETHNIDLPFSMPNIRNLLAIPLGQQDKPIGILMLLNKVHSSFFNKEDEDLLMTYGFQAALSIENANLHEHNKRLAITDGLTELYNHRELQNMLSSEVKRCIRYKRFFSLLMIDIDHFKTFNDTYGHPMGDKVLREVSNTIRDSIREIDIPARYGGEEFVVILPETSYDHALIVAERIRGNIYEKSFGKNLENEEFFITVSVGVSAFPEDGLNRDELISRVDQALYFAKREGRNRVRRYDETLKSFIEHKEDHIEDILKDAKIKVIRDLAAAVDAKNSYTRGHTDEVVHYAVSLAKALKLPAGEIENLRLASLLHDIGTVSIPDEIMNKRGPLNDEERSIVQGHPEFGEMILQKASQLESIIPAILYHHEQYDGNGYPNGLKGKKIPLLARILSVVEAYQAMISERPYRERLSQEAALKELRENAGKQFDPDMVEIFVELFS